MREWPKFCTYLSAFLREYYIHAAGCELPDNIDDVEKFRKDIMVTVGSSKKAMKALIKVCGFAKVKRFFVANWMKQAFSIDDWVEVFLWVYLFNIKSVKKNLSDVYEQIFKAPLLLKAAQQK
jgi:hypothetical protein